jgi:hypothetical protein
MVISAILGIVLGGCAGETEETTSTAGDVTTTTVVTTTTTTTTTTTVPTTPTTTTPTATTTTAATTTTVYAAGTPTLFPPPAGGDGAAGSGCSPGGDTLPDGVWFGYIVARDGATIEFDLACFFFGDIAYEKGAEAGEEVANDYFVSNVNPTLRSIGIEGGVPVYEIDATQPDQFLTVSFADWPLDPSGYIACPDPFCGVWLYVNGGAVTEIVEQYVP